MSASAIAAQLDMTGRRVLITGAAGGVGTAFARTFHDAGATLVLAVQTDVIGDPWMAYCLWALAGIALRPLPILRE